MNQTRIEKALIVAARAHQNQKRKQTNIPYIVHPVGVAFILIDEGCDDDLIVSGLLHDVVEDSSVTLAEIRSDFGDRVAEIVKACTEPDKKMPWEQRKQLMLKRIEGGSLDFKIVSCADKLHNIRTMIAEYPRVGERLWERFSRGRDKQEWYHRSLVSSFFHDLPEKNTIPIFTRFRQHVEMLFGEI